MEVEEEEELLHTGGQEATVRGEGAVVTLEDDVLELCHAVRGTLSCWRTQGHLGYEISSLTTIGTVVALWT